MQSNNNPYPSLPSFVFDHKVGSGSCGDVYKVIREITKETYAVKCVRRKLLVPAARDNLLSEIEILKLVKHPNVIRMIDFQWDLNYIYIIMEFCDGGDLASLIKQKSTLTEYLTQKIMVQISQAFNYLNHLKISHFDLKPSNILIKYKNYDTNLIVKIADFGLAKFINHAEDINNLRGSLLYMAPEIFLNHDYSCKADLWSLGVILYECLYGNPPYMSKTYKELFDKIKSPNKVVIQGKKISPSCRDLLEKLLQKDPKVRINFQELYKHPYITGASFKNFSDQNLDSKSLILKANELLENAYEKEISCDYNNAFNMYIDAAQTLLPLINKELNINRQQRMKSFIGDFLDRAEKIKAKINHKKRDISMSNETHANNINDEFLDDPQVQAAIKLSDAANIYQENADFKSLEIALSKFEICIEAMFQKLQQLSKKSENDTQNFNVKNPPPDNFGVMSKKQHFIINLVDGWTKEVEKIKHCLLLEGIKRENLCNEYKMPHETSSVKSQNTPLFHNTMQKLENLFGDLKTIPSFHPNVSQNEQNLIPNTNGNTNTSPKNCILE